MVAVNAVLGTRRDSGAVTNGESSPSESDPECEVYRGVWRVAFRGLARVGFDVDGGGRNTAVSAAPGLRRRAIAIARIAMCVHFVYARVAMAVVARRPVGVRRNCLLIGWLRGNGAHVPLRRHTKSSPPATRKTLKSTK